MSSQAQDLIAKKNYPKALDVIKAELAKRPKDQRLRLQQADVLILAARFKEAVSVLLGLADEHAADGFAAKAIAILKRIEKVEPGRRDVEERLAHLIQEKVSQAPTAARPAAVPDFGMEELPSGEIDLGMVGASVDAPAPAAQVDEGLDYIASVEPEPEPPAQPALTSPLFEGLSQQELVALIHGLKLLNFSPGDILVGEGAPGDSMFIITTGRVKAYVRDPKGHYLKVQELGEGAFFGEISLLTGKPRTATITAASSIEVLELDKATFDSITRTYPRIRETLERFRVERAQDTIKKIIKSQK